MLAVFPAVFVGAALVQTLLLWLWRRRHRDVALRWRPLLMVTSSLALPSLASWVFRSPIYEPLMALLCFGCSYLTVLLLSTRLWLIFDRRHAHVLAHLPPLVLFLGAAVPMALGWWRGIGHSPDWLFLAPDVYVVPVAAVLLPEALLRWWWARRRAQPENVSSSVA